MQQLRAKTSVLYKINFIIIITIVAIIAIIIVVIIIIKNSVEIGKFTPSYLFRIQSVWGLVILKILKNLNNLKN